MAAAPLLAPCTTNPSRSRTRFVMARVLSSGSRLRITAIFRFGLIFHPSGAAGGLAGGVILIFLGEACVQCPQADSQQARGFAFVPIHTFHSEPDVFVLDLFERTSCVELDPPLAV